MAYDARVASGVAAPENKGSNHSSSDTEEFVADDDDGDNLVGWCDDGSGDGIHGAWI